MASNDPHATVRAHARVRGHVQGVYFRASTQVHARQLGLAGWVRNRRDGSVELVAEGPPVQVEALLAYVLKGPPLASVTDVERVDCEPVGLDGEFSVRPTR